MKSRQYQRTDKQIIHAFLEIVDKENMIDNITINDITEVAMINRSTFYKHFSDKYAILEKLHNDYVNSFFSSIEEITNLDHLTLEEIDESMYKLLEKDRAIFKKMFKIKSDFFNIEKELKKMFFIKISKKYPTFSSIESTLCSNMLVDFLILYITSDESTNNFSTLLFQSFFNISLNFFQIKTPEGTTKMLNLIEQYRDK